MCADGDNARHATDFVNSQLKSLYDIAGDCIEHYGDTASKQPGYDFALREYYYKSKTSSPVKFEFGVPEVEFICNHDAILRLDIQNVTSESFVHPDHKRKDYTTFQARETESIVTDPLVHFKGKVSVRVPFANYKLTGESEAIGNGEHVLHNFILGLSKGSCVQTPDTVEVTLAHRPYLEAYLEHLAKSGYHVLSSLPDNNGDGKERVIDFSSAANALYGHITNAFGIELTQIIKHVEDIWLKAAWLAREYQQEQKGDLAIRNAIAVAKWERHWRPSSAPFDVEFGAPTVQLLCEREAVLILSLEKIDFHAGTNNQRSFQNWKVAVIVDVTQEIQEGGAVTILRTNGGKAKFAEHLSDFGGEEFNDDVSWESYQALVTFLCREYLQFLEIGDFYLYYHDSRVFLPGKKEDWVGTVEDPDYLDRITTSTDMYGFQQIFVLSHASLDNIFAAYHKEREWMRYSNKDGFEINFGVPKVRLLSDSRALVFIDLKSGTLHTSSSDGDKLPFENWTLAFEVTLAMREVKLETYREKAEFRQTKAFEDSKDWTDRYLKQLYINFDGAKFNYQLSKFDDPNFGKNNLSIRKVSAINQYLETHFLGEIKDASTDILYSIVLSRDKSAARIRYAFSDATFHIYSNLEVTHRNYNILPAHQEPLIVILGMTDPERQLPFKSLRYSSGWMLRPGYSLGTVALSSELFLNGRLVPLLASIINRPTTLLPVSFEIDKGYWSTPLVRWSDKHEADKDHTIHPTSWELIPNGNPRAFEYKWDHGDEFEYNYTRVHNGGTYYLSVVTGNRLTIPISFRAGQLDITIKGTTSLTLGWKNEKYSARHTASVSWTIVVSVITKPGGLDVQITSQFDPQYELTKEGFITPEDSHKINDPKVILESVFPRLLPIEEIVKTLKEFETVWNFLYPGLKGYRFANPFFTEKGDLLLELHEHDQISGSDGVPALGQRGAVPLVLSRPKGKSGTSPSSGKTPLAIEPGRGGSAPRSESATAKSATTDKSRANGVPAANGNGATIANVKAN